MLRDQNGMAAVNALCGAANGRESHTDDRSRLTWSGLKDLDLSVATTFRPDYWKLYRNWNTCNSYSKSWTPLTISLSVLVILGVKFRLCLPQLVPGDICRMEALFRMMGLHGRLITNPVSLQLPGARIDTNFLLGVLRDSGQH